MKRIQKYDEAFEIWLEFKDGLFGYIYKKVQDSELAEEINQQVLMKVIKTCCSNIPIRNVRSWLFQIAHNTTIDCLKKMKRLWELDDQLEVSFEDPVRDEITPLLASLMKFLPKEYEEPLRLFDIDGLKQVEIAKKLNLSLSATKSRIQRARVLLKKEVLTCFHIDADELNGMGDFSLKLSCKPLQEIKEKNN